MEDAVLVKAKEWAGSLEKLLSDKLFFASETAPGYLDFTLRGQSITSRQVHLS